VLADLPGMRYSCIKIPPVKFQLTNLRLPRSKLCPGSSNGAIPSSKLRPGICSGEH
jgi:hypothetical protein